MHILKSVLIAVAAAVLSVPALAAPKDPYIKPTVTAVPTEVTLRREGLDTSASFRLDLTNNSTNSLSRIFLEGTATVTGTGATAAAFDGHLLAVAGGLSVKGGNCSSTTTGVATTVRCDFDGSLGPDGRLEFFVIFDAPTGGQKINFAGKAGGYEGRSLTGQGCCAADVTGETLLADPTNSTSSNSYLKNAQTFLRPTGGTLFTGDQAKATLGDPWSTKVVITEGTGIDYIATIKEDASPASDACGTSVPTCFISTLDIDGAFANFLKITLRRDVSTIPKRDRYDQSVLDRAKIFYSVAPLGDALYNPVEVYACSPSPTAGVPCWKSKTVFLRDAPAADAGDWLIELWAADNGSYRF